MTASSVLGIIYARMDSSRLPGKPLLKAASKPLIQYVVDRVAKIETLSKIVLATSERTVDDPLEEWGGSQDIPVFRGATDDVMQRTIQCLENYPYDYFIRLNGDSPWLDPGLISQSIKLTRTEPDLITNLRRRTFPYGISVEIIKSKAFLLAADRMLSGDQREHITQYLYQNSTLFDIIDVLAETEGVKTGGAPNSGWASSRLTVDTPEDFERFKSAVNRLGDKTAFASYQTVAQIYQSVLVG